MRSTNGYGKKFHFLSQNLKIGSVAACVFLYRLFSLCGNNNSLRIFGENPPTKTKRKQRNFYGLLNNFIGLKQSNGSNNRRFAPYDCLLPSHIKLSNAHGYCTLTNEKRSIVSCSVATLVQPKCLRTANLTTLKTVSGGNARKNIGNNCRFESSGEAEE